MTELEKQDRQLELESKALKSKALKTLDDWINKFKEYER